MRLPGAAEVLLFCANWASTMPKQTVIHAGEADSV
jgi:hypothetical protein